MMLVALFQMSPAHALAGTLVAFLPAPFYLAIWLWLDRYDPEPAWALAGAWLWGGGVATFISYIVNTLSGSLTHAVTGSPALANFMSSSVSAPLVEEFTKGLPVVLILLLFRREFDGVMDGIVYAGVVALGFATVENVLYYGRNLMTDGFSGLFATFVVRGLLDPFGHSVYTAMTGIGCGISRVTRNKAARWLAPLGGYAVAVTLHFLWNSIAMLAGGVGILVYYLLIWVPLLLVFLAVVLWIGAREARLIRTMLDFEVACRLITPEQAAIVGSWFKRVGWVLGATGDGKKFSARRRFLHAATRLAFSYWHADRAREAGTQTLSLARIPFFRKELESLQSSV
jgi:RsiW-degrading membrane proteinase PrsW (M82 family)